MEFKVTKLSKISNAIFLLLTLFLLSFIWLEFYIRKIRLSLIISIPISIAIYIIYSQIKKLIEKSKVKKLKTKQSKDNIILQLSLGKESLINQYLLNLFDYTNALELSSNHYILDNTTDIAFSFEKECLEQETFNSIIRKRHTDNINIFCNDFKVSHMPKNIEINFINIDKIYTQIIDKESIIPSNIELKKQPKYRLKDILCIVFNKSKSLKYFYTSLLIIFASLFTPFTNYYIIISTLLLIASVYSKFNTRYN